MRYLSSIITAALLLLSVTVEARVHDEFRFVGTVVKYDPAKTRLEINARETDEAGKVTISLVRMSVPADVEVTRILQRVSRSELKPGVFVIVDAAGVGTEMDATAIEIVVPPKPAVKPPATKATAPRPAATTK